MANRFGTMVRKKAQRPLRAVSPSTCELAAVSTAFPEVGMIRNRTNVPCS